MVCQLDALDHHLCAVAVEICARPLDRKRCLDKPALVVSASYDEGKFERVRFGQVGEEAFGAREGEAVVARIDKALMAAAMKAFDLVVMPPEPAPAAADKAGEKK